MQERLECILNDPDVLKSSNDRYVLVNTSCRVVIKCWFALCKYEYDRNPDHMSFADLSCMFSKSESVHLLFKVFGFHANCHLDVNAVTSSFKVIPNCTLPITILKCFAFIKRKMQCSNPEITLFRAAEGLSVWKHVPAVYLLQTQDVRNRLKSVPFWTCYCRVFVQLGFFNLYALVVE